MQSSIVTASLCQLSALTLDCSRWGGRKGRKRGQERQRVTVCESWKAGTVGESVYVTMMECSACEFVPAAVHRVRTQLPTAHSHTALTTVHVLIVSSRTSFLFTVTRVFSNSHSFTALSAIVVSTVSTHCTALASRCASPFSHSSIARRVGVAAAGPKAATADTA